MMWDGGKNLRAWYQGQGWTRELLAEALGVDTMTIRRWEKGTSIPRGDRLDKIREILGDQKFDGK